MTNGTILYNTRLVNLARTVVADEPNVIAVHAVNAGDLREAAPPRAMVCRDLLIDRFDIRRIGENAAGVIASHARPRTSKFRAPRER